MSEKFKTTRRTLAFVVVSLSCLTYLCGCGAGVHSATGLGSASGTGSSTNGGGQSTTSGATPTLAIVAPVTSVRIGSTLTLTAKIGDAVCVGGKWSVVGSSDSGSISDGGVYSAPPSMPTSGTAKVQYASNGQVAELSLSLLNPVPTILSVTPDKITSSSTTVSLTVSGLLTTTRLLVAGSDIPYTKVAGTNIRAVLQLPLNAPAQVPIQLSNPGPGTATSDVYYMSVSMALPKVSPVIIPTGEISLEITSPSGLPAKPVVTLDGNLLATTQLNATTLKATGYIPPWKTGALTLSLGDGSSVCNCMTVNVKPTAVPYDTASRFATQAAWGPRQDVVEHIQQVGLQPWIAEQMSMAPASYDVTGTFGNPRVRFLVNATSGQTFLRERIAYGLQSFIPSGGALNQMVTLPWELKLEQHAFGSYKQILMDAASTYGPAALLNLPGNNVRPGTKDVPNQNFARELLQLFSIGPYLLNEDGTLKLDSANERQLSYGPDTIADLSRVFTGWQAVTGGDPVYSSGGVDYSADLVALESMHDKGPKTLFGSVLLPAGQTAAKDRQQAIQAIFDHPNVPPFVCRLLIQRLVKSQPTSAYIYRVVQVFKDDGTGVRGNLGAVIKAILLDPEARAGDVNDAGPQDGFIQTPLQAQLALMNLLELKYFDGNPIYFPAYFGEDFWFNWTVQGFFSPTYTIPGTSVISPEFQLLNSNTILARSQFIYGVVTCQQRLFPSGNYSLYEHFKSPESMVEAMDHMLYHGKMPTATKEAVLSLSRSQKTLLAQQQIAIAASLIDDNYLAQH